jgi:hypothetical protein
MKKCFREPMESFPGMSPVELDCIFRNLDQLIHLHSKKKIKFLLIYIYTSCCMSEQNRRV